MRGQGRGRGEGEGRAKGNKVQTSISYLRYVILNSVADRGWVPEIYEYLLNFSAEPMERCNEMEIYVRHISQSQRNFAAAQVCRNPALSRSLPLLPRSAVLHDLQPLSPHKTS